MEAMDNSYKTPKIETADNFHGVSVSDPYRWLEKSDDPKVKKWVVQQNNQTRLILSKIISRDKIKKSLKKILKTDSFSVPISRNNYIFFTKRKKTDDLEILYVQNGLRGTPKILIDPNKLSKEKTTVLRSWQPSNDGKLIAYSLSESANDQSSIHILDVEKNKKTSDTIPAEVYPALHSAIEWSCDNKGFWYTRRDIKSSKNKLGQKIFYHQIGDNFKNDKMIFGETIAREDIPSIQTSNDGCYLLVSVHKFSTTKEKTEIYLFDTNKKDAGFIPVAKDQEAMFFGVLHRGIIYIRTNHNAPLWKVMAVDISKKNFKINKWDTIITETEYKIENFKISGNKLFIETLENGHSSLKYSCLDGHFIKKIPLPAVGSLTAINAEKEGSNLFFGFSSFLIPHFIYRFNLNQERLAVFKKEKNCIDPSQYIVKQSQCISKDNTKVPLFIVHKKEIKLNGKNPLLLYGYGGFGISIVPRFNKNIIPFIENGGIYAIANIRGGGELGENWHKDGVGKRKQKVFDDFISTAEWLIKNGYTNSSKIGAIGWSNGGLLVGAVITQKPHLFKVAIIGAPVLDMLRYHLFLGGRLWIPEYGNSENRKMFKYLLSYSPYHNIRNNVHYPAIMLVTADNDDRVHPMHAYKMTARLQELNASPDQIILRTETTAGHGGAVSIHKLIEQETDILSFVFDSLGMK